MLVESHPLTQSPARRVSYVSVRCALWIALLAGGCHTWPFARPERTTFITPAMRAAAIQEAGARADGANELEKLEICQQLVQQIRTEPDPLVRETIQRTIGQIDHPLAADVLAAGLQDADREVRITCCRWLGRRAKEESVPDLRRIAATDADIDVRLAAVDALGGIKAPASVRALEVALQDRDPAMQFAGVQALRHASGEDLGNDVAAWRRYLATLTPVGERTISVAEGPNSTSTY